MKIDIQDREIQKMFEGARIKRVPAEHLKNYEQDVMLKVRAAESAPVIGMPAMALAVAAIVLIGCIWFFYNRPAVVIQPLKQERVSPTAAGQIIIHDIQKNIPVDKVPFESAKPRAQEVENAKFEKIEREMFILEMLGEDEGLMDDFDRVSGDMDLLSKISPSVA